MAYRRYSLIDYFDVWGNEEDGWTVNNQCEVADDIIIADEATDLGIIGGLVNSGFLKEEARDYVTIDDFGPDALDIVSKIDWKPIFGLRAIQ